MNSWLSCGSSVPRMFLTIYMFGVLAFKKNHLIFMLLTQALVFLKCIIPTSFYLFIFFFYISYLVRF